MLLLFQNPRSPAASEIIVFEPGEELADGRTIFRPLRDQAPSTSEPKSDEEPSLPDIELTSEISSPPPAKRSKESPEVSQFL